MANTSPFCHFHASRKPWPQAMEACLRFLYEYFRAELTSWRRTCAPSALVLRSDETTNAYHGDMAVSAGRTITTRCRHQGYPHQGMATCAAWLELLAFFTLGSSKSA